MSDIELRLHILNLVNENPRVNAPELSKQLGVDLQKIQRAIKFLHEDKCIRGCETESGNVAILGITSEGVKKLEGPSVFNQPTGHIDQSIRISAPVFGSNIVSGNNNVGFRVEVSGNSLQIREAAKLLKDAVRNHQLSDVETRELEVSIDKIESEVLKSDPNTDVVEARTESFLEKLKSRSIQLATLTVPLMTLINFAPAAVEKVRIMIEHFSQ